MCSSWRRCALLALALLAFSSDLTDARAQSDRSRHRSGPIKSIPLGADIKRDTEFNCPEEFGYYPHPNDCSQYYVCVFGGALLESCTGGLMYSHELQTCDWPRNVGCDATSSGAGDAEPSGNREPAPPPPRRTPPPPPPPPPRAQPNPVVTSRGQPRISQDEYIKQQQLYSEIDELPPADEIESDRPQRVYRGQPSTIGQVQRDRDGYSSQISAGRSLNANIIPASISQPSGKIGAFSFGTQVDQRRTASPSQEPQSYSEKQNVTDNTDQPRDYETNQIDGQNDDIDPDRIIIRKKRDISSNDTKEEHFSEDPAKENLNRKDKYIEEEEEEPLDMEESESGNYEMDDVDRNKRQVRHGRYQYNNGYHRNAGVKSWTTPKPIKSVEISQFNQKPPHHYDGGIVNLYNPQQYNNNGYQDVSNKPYLSDNTVFTTANPFQQYQTSPNFHNKPFKASSPDPYSLLPFSPMNAATQIITKSPPISSLVNNENPFASLSGGFYNNNSPRQNIEQAIGNTNQNFNKNPPYYQQDFYNGFNVKYQDSSEVPSTVVTDKPIKIQSTTQARIKYRMKPEGNSNKQGNVQVTRRPNYDDKTNDDVKVPQVNEEEEYDEDSEEEDDDSEDENNNTTTQNHEVNVPDFPEPPYEFTHHSTKDKYADIVNPFADPNFDFDAFISKLRDSHLSTLGQTTPAPQKYQYSTPKRTSVTPRRPTVEIIKSERQRLVTNSGVSYQGMSTPTPFSVPTKSLVLWPARGNSGTTNEPSASNVHHNQESVKQLNQYSHHDAQNFHSQLKSPKLLKYTFNGNENNHQAAIPNVNGNNDYRNQYQKNNVKIIEETRSTNKPFAPDNRYQDANLHNHNQYDVNTATSAQNQASQPPTYTFGGEDQKFAKLVYSSENPNLRFKPPNFKDDRRLPIDHNFNSEVGGLHPPPEKNINNFRTTDGRDIVAVTSKPYITLMVTSPSPLSYTTKPQQLYSVNPQSVFTGRPQVIISGKTAYFTTAKPHSYNMNFNPSFTGGLTPYLQPTKANFVSSTETAKNQFLHSVTAPPRSYPTSIKNYFVNTSTTTAKPTPKRRPIPKPSPEMNDYYYDDDEEYYYEPPVKSQFMPSSEVRPQRPLIAQNDEEYEDDEDYDDKETTKSVKTTQGRPGAYKAHQPNTRLKHYNDVSEPTKRPYKQGSVGNVNGKIPIPVMMFGSSTPPTISRPQVANYEVLHPQKNKSSTYRKPYRFRDSGPHTVKPPKYLNQTTLRPYTVRHRLAKPTTVPMSTTTEIKQTRGPNKWRQTTTTTKDSTVKSTTPHDSHNQETRFTKTRHDDRTNSLEPTESVTPVAYSPRPTAGRALYNGSQNYNPDQYDPYYALYDEDGELYKDSDYVQQYNSASIRPAVQQTYRGTPPPQPAPTRRPQQDIYTARPVSADEYDDALIQGQIDDQTQYQQPIRQSTRGEGNELGYEHNPSSVRTTIYEATSISTTPSTTTSTSSTTTTTTTTQRPTSAPITEAMIPSRNTQRSTTDESISRRANASATEKSSISDYPSDSQSENPVNPLNFSLLAKPFQKTSNSLRLKTLVSDDPVSFHSGIASNFSFPYPESTTVMTRPVTNNTNNRQHFSLTTGFSIRRNPNNTQSPYTLTVLTRPPSSSHIKENDQKVVEGGTENDLQKYFYDRTSYRETEKNHTASEETGNISNRRADDDIYETVGLKAQESIPSDNRYDPLEYDDSQTSKPEEIDSSESMTEIPVDYHPIEKTPSRAYLKTIIKRPAPFSIKQDAKKPAQSYESQKKWVPLIQRAFEISQRSITRDESVIKPSENDGYSFPETRNRVSFMDAKPHGKTVLRQPPVSPFESLQTLRQENEKKVIFQSRNSNANFDQIKPTDNTKHESYKTSHNRGILPQDNKSEQIKQYIRDLNSTHNVEITSETNRYLAFSEDKTEPYNKNKQISEPKFYETTTTILDNPLKPQREVAARAASQKETVNIGFRKRIPNYASSEKIPTNNRRLQILRNEPKSSSEEYNQAIVEVSQNSDNQYSFDKVVSSTPQPSTHNPVLIPTTKEPEVTSTSNHVTPKYDYFRRSEESFEYTTYTSKFDNIAQDQVSKPEDFRSQSRKFKDLLDADDRESEKNTDIFSNTVGTELTELIKTRLEPVTLIPYPRQNETIDHRSDQIVTTTRMTMKTIDSTTTPTAKTTPYPTRASRINPAIKLAATNPGAGRRSYQSSSKCSTDNSLQANPKCNEIKYQRTNTRGRGSAHYSTSSGSEAPQFNNVNNANRGTPPARLRPTLKPSTSIVSKEAAFVDIYQYPPTRPPAIYPQPTPDKTAAKCRKDVCLLPDCYCGGKDIPGELPVESVPQMVLLTFDDSVNDLNKVLYADLFEKGRVNPNGCPLAATFYVSHEWTDYSQVQNLYAGGHEMASHTISHSFGEQFSQKKWNREVAGQREILSAYGGVKLEDVRGMRAPFLSVGGNKMFKMLYDSNFTYDSSMPVYENRPPSWPYTLDYKLFHDCMIPPCPTRSYPGVWEVPMVMWQDLNGGRCSMGDACSNPPTAEGVYKMLLKNFDRHYTTNRAPFGLFYHAAWFTQPHHKEGFIMFMDAINQMQDVFFVTNWQALQWVRDPTPLSRINSFQPFHCDYPDRPKRCNNPKVCNLWHKSGVRYMRTCQPCPDVFPWTGKTGIRSSRIDNETEE